MKNIEERPRGKAITQESFGMEARDFACILLPAIDYDSQLQAIGSLLEQHRQNEQRSSERILEIERELPSLSGVRSHMANDERVDLLNMSVYADAAHSMAAIGMLAPFIESVFYQAFQSARTYFGDATDLLPEHPRWKEDREARWDCRFIWKNGEKKGNLIEGIMQLSSATGLKEFLPSDLRKTLSAVFAYRNKMFHLGFEWPMAEREKFRARILSEKWPDHWFAWATSDSQPWVCYMTDTLISECIALISKVLHAMGEFAVEKLPGGSANER
jgi:hypothetical protein